MSSIPPQKILYISFNYNGEYFTCGLLTGFCVYKTSNPFSLKINRNLNRSIIIVEMLKESNIFALVDGGQNAKYPQYKLFIFDDNLNRNIKEFRFNSFINNVKMKLKKIFVICTENINIINIDNNKMEIEYSFCTIENRNGICAIANNPGCYVFAWPDIEKGKVKIKNFKNIENNNNNNLNNNNLNNNNNINNNNPNNNNNIIIKAHESYIDNLEINYNGSLIATASDKGTLIRIFNIKENKLIQELRRGTEKAKIYSISFDINSDYLAVTSDRGTTHLFVINYNNNNNNNKNTKSIFGNMSKMIGIGKLFQSEWSFAQIPGEKNIKSICYLYGNNKNIYIVEYDGNFINEKYEEGNKNCVKIERWNFYDKDLKIS